MVQSGLAVVSILGPSTASLNWPSIPWAKVFKFSDPTKSKKKKYTGFIKKYAEAGKKRNKTFNDVNCIPVTKLNKSNEIENPSSLEIQMFQISKKTDGDFVI